MRGEGFSARVRGATAHRGQPSGCARPGRARSALHESARRRTARIASKFASTSTCVPRAGPRDQARQRRCRIAPKGVLSRFCEVSTTRAYTEVSTTRHGPRRPTRALSLPPLHPDAPRSLCRPRSRHNHRAAARRSARAAVSRARLSPAALAKTNSVPQGLLERLSSLYPPSCHAAAAALVSPLSLRRGRGRTEVPRPCE